MASTKLLMTAEQLFDLPEDGRRYELVNGELHEMTPPGGPHGTVQLRFGHLLASFIDENAPDFLYGVEAGVILRRNPDTVRGPDVYVIDRSRLPEGDLDDGYFTAVPDLVVEVVSPGDRAGEIQERVEDWLNAGVRLLIVVYPRRRTVIAYRGRENIRHYREDEEFDIEPVLAGFRCRVSQLFEPLKSK